MNGDCFEIGTFQAFLDGELSSVESARLTKHIAVCDKCAHELAAAEDESAIVFPALAREMDTLVPTQRLWNKINDAIAVERDNMPFWQKAWAFLTVALVNPSIAVAASVLIIAVVIAAVWINRGNVTDPSADKVVTKNQPAISLPNPIGVAPFVSTGVNSTSGQSTVVTPSFHRNALQNMTVNASYSTTGKSKIKDQSSKPADGYMPGEESYVKTISSLARSVNGQKDSVMRPSERIAFESDMAVVDDAITKMRKEVKKNPKNESARQVLYASYQNKIDLLNSVSQKQELMASLR